MANILLLEEELTRSVIGAFFEVYNTLGYGFLEGVYVKALSQELVSRGHSVAREVRIPVSYKGTIVAFQRLDMVVDGRLIVETKATDELHEGARRQLYNYLRASDLKIGLLLHFGPRAKFYRMICRASRSDRIDPAFPSNPLIRISTPSRDDGASYRRPTNR